MQDDEEADDEQRGKTHNGTRGARTTSAVHHKVGTVGPSDRDTGVGLPGVTAQALGDRGGENNLFSLMGNNLGKQASIDESSFQRVPAL